MGTGDLWDEMYNLSTSLLQQAASPRTPPVQSGIYTEDAKRMRRILDRYAGTAEGRPAPEPPAAHITLAAEIKPGGWYVLQTERKLSAQEAMRCKEQLNHLFPGVTFAIIDGDLKFVTELADLRGAVERARGKAKDYWLTAKTESELLSYHAVACAMEMLAGELQHPERDGAGAPPAAGTAAESATPTPAPSPFLCGAQHPTIPGVTCQVVPGDHRNKEHVAETPDGVYRWRP